jgi:peptidoglycan/LPS O-acetylase OafA/YrhL
MPLLVIACFILVAKGSNTKDLDIRFLASKPLTYIGDRSYSLYISH